MTIKIWQSLNSDWKWKNNFLACSKTLSSVFVFFYCIKFYNYSWCGSILIYFIFVFCRLHSNVIDFKWFLMQFNFVFLNFLQKFWKFYNRKWSYLKVLTIGLVVKILLCLFFFWIVLFFGEIIFWGFFLAIIKKTLSKYWMRPFSFVFFIS